MCSASSTPLPAARGRVEAVQVWDPVVRLCHWGLVACVLLNRFVLEDGKSAHQWAGYAATVLVLGRCVWGFVGSPHARFADFWPTPQRLRQHLAELRSGQHRPGLGHNPLGALMMLALLGLVLALGVTGFMQSLDRFWGDEGLQDLHGLLADGLIALALLHVLAALVMSRLDRVNLVAAMVNGRKVFGATRRA